MGKSEQFVRLKAESTYIKGVSLISNVYSNVPMYPHNNRVTKKHANWLFFREIIQPNLPKFAYNLIHGRRVRI